MKTVLVLMLLLLSLPSYGEEPKVYTEQDLERYKKQSTYDEETILRRDTELRRWEIEKQTEEELIREQRAKEEKEIGQQRDSTKGRPEISRETANESNRDGTHAARKKKKA